ncbi:hypothetical protein VN24_22440 [Paenibacillus beijingensis]|uniref:Oxidoreductase n=2 Tax=Paenibacillus beijingensis TaxID=1126833 RepID=A0A0D5NP84_9BACL|nr:hypothetical protein VN24_22440 [Paenibacillus beijingensis]
MRKERLEQMVNAYAIRGYQDDEEMLKHENLDFVSVCVPAAAHREVVEKAATYGVHILCEKPLAVTREDAAAMIAACQEAGVKLFYGASYRYLPAIMKAKEMIDKGMLGNISLMMEHVIGGNGLEGFRDLGPHHYPAGGPGGGGLGLMDHGIHLVDLFRWFTGSEIVTVAGRGNISGAKPSTEYLTATTATGATGILIYNEATFSSDIPTEGIFSEGQSWDASGPQPAHAWHKHPQNIRVHGEKGSLRIFHYANKIYFTDKDKTIEVPGIEQCANPFHFSSQMRAIVRCIRNQQEPEVTGNDGLKALEVVLAAYESYETQSMIRINHS